MKSLSDLIRKNCKHNYKFDIANGLSLYFPKTLKSLGMEFKSQTYFPIASRFGMSAVSGIFPIKTHSASKSNDTKTQHLFPSGQIEG